MNIVDVFRGLADAASEEKLLLLALLLGLGGALGSIKIRGFSLGPAAVLFTALGMSAFDERLVVARDIGIFGLAIFAYVIGIQAGPSFFHALRTGGRTLLAVTLTLSVAGLITVLAAALLGISGPLLSGIYAGALTNTPALAAANQAWNSDLPTVGYSVTYLGGVLGMLIGVGLALRTSTTHEFDDAETSEQPIDSMTIRIDAPHLQTVGAVMDEYDNQFVFSRIMRGDSPGHPGTVAIAVENDTLEPGDIVTVVGNPEKIQEFVARAGHPSTVALTLDRSHVDYRRITVSNADLSGKTIEDLRLQRKFGAVITRVRRGDVDLLARESLTLQVGDRVRVVAPRKKLGEVATFFGDSEKAAQSFNLTALALGLVAGVLLGLIEIPLPGDSTFALGMAGGPLLVGLLLGRRGRSGRMLWTLPSSAATTLQHLGMMLFLAYAGSHSGSALAEAVQTPVGWRLFVIGAIVTLLTAGLHLTLTRKLGRVAGAELAGVMSGSQTQPAVLAYANERSGDNPHVNLGYALAYPIAMMAKVLIAPLLGRF
jgi:putative transport protein